MLAQIDSEITQSKQASGGEYDFHFEAALKPDWRGNYLQGHPEPKLEYDDWQRREKKTHKTLMNQTDCRDNMRYLRTKLDTIQVTGGNKVKGGDRKKLKSLEAKLLKDDDDDDHD